MIDISAVGVIAGLVFALFGAKFGVLWSVVGFAAGFFGVWAFILAVMFVSVTLEDRADRNLREWQRRNKIR